MSSSTHTAASQAAKTLSFMRAAGAEILKTFAEATLVSVIPFKIAGYAGLLKDTAQPIGQTIDQYHDNVMGSGAFAGMLVLGSLALASGLMRSNAPAPQPANERGETLAL